jgi:hypothetical protein
VRPTAEPSSSPAAIESAQPTVEPSSSPVAIESAPPATNATQSKNTLIGKAATLETSQDFSEDRAFITYEMWYYKGVAVDTPDLDTLLDLYMSGKTQDMKQVKKYAIIDTQGNIIWESTPLTRETANCWFSTFKDGLAYFGSSDTDFSIIDSDGNITYSQESGYSVVGYGSGLFVVTQHVSNFDTDEWQIGAIDKNGKLVVPFEAIVKPKKPYESDIDYIPENLSFEGSECTHIGSNVFLLESEQWQLIINVEKHSVILDPYEDFIVNLYTNFDAGYAIASVGYPESYNYDR